MMSYSKEDYLRFAPVWIAVFLAYIFAIPFYFAFTAWSDSMFYGGAHMYKITWAHYLLPAVGALAVYLFAEWYDKEFKARATRWFFWTSYLGAVFLVLLYMFAYGSSVLEMTLVVGGLALLAYFGIVKKVPSSAFSDSLWFLLAVLILYFAGFVLGIWSFGYTFVMMGMRVPVGETLLKLFVFLPYWALLPGLLAGWVARWWEVASNKR